MAVTLPAWIAYAAERGNAAPGDADATAANAALVRAGDYIKFRYVQWFCDPANALLPVVDEATYIAASIELTNPGFFSKTYTPAEQKVLTEVKGIKWEIVGKNNEVGATPVSTMIDAMLLPYYCGPGVMKPRQLGIWALGS